MNRRDKKRVEILERVDPSCDGVQLLREEGVGARRLADIFLEMQAQFIERTGGAPRFTGNNRVFKNGAVAYQIECRKCKQCFWVTTVASALCPDCDETGMFLEYPD